MLRWEARCASVAHGVLTHLSPGLVQDNGANDYENQARLSRFQGSQSISSSDYFGREESGGRGGGGGGGGGGGADFDVTAGELMSKLSVQVVCWAFSRTLASTQGPIHERYYGANWNGPGQVCVIAASVHDVTCTAKSKWMSLQAAHSKTCDAGMIDYRHTADDAGKAGHDANKEYGRHSQPQAG